MRIHGRIGDWPVDLTLELDAGELASLAAALRGAAEVAPEAAPPEAAPPVVEVPPAPRADAAQRLWELACALLAGAGAMDGPQLLGELSALAGDVQAGKRLLVRLRHSPQVRVEAGAQAPCYRWIGAAPRP